MSSGISTPTKPVAPVWQQHTCAVAAVDKHAAHAKNTSADQPGLHAMKAVLIRAEGMWVNESVLTYSFLSSSPGNSIQQAKVKAVVPEWEKYANIKFEHVEDEDAVIRITFDATYGSWSYVGREVSQVHDTATMNLGWVDGRSANITPEERGVILHEFGHTLGLMHEHQSPVRGDKITLNEEAVIEQYTKSQGWTVEDVRSQIINVYNAGEVSNYSKLDTKSVMMYFMPREMNVQKIEVKPNNQLSDTDKAFVTINYPYPPSHTPADEAWTFSYALDVVGISGAEKDLILHEYQKKNWTEVRYQFARYCVAARGAQIMHGLNEKAKPVEVLESEYEWCGSDRTRSAPPGVSSGVATISDHLWLPGDRITYAFIQGIVEATPYRKSRVAQTFDTWKQIANLSIEEVAYNPLKPEADIHVYFGPIPGNVAAWSVVGNQSKGFTQSQSDITKWGGTYESSIVFSDEVVPASAPTDPAVINKEQRTLLHEVGHALGLRHEHDSPHTMTTDTPTPYASVATPFDSKSIMLYPYRELRSSSVWESIKDCFNPRATQFNHTLSQFDKAFIAALYPAPNGHVNDRFHDNIRALGIGSSFIALSAKRDRAYNNVGLPEFVVEVQQLRSDINAALSALVSKQRQYSVKPAQGVHTPPAAPIKARGITAPAKASEGPFLTAMVNMLSSLFAPTSGQIFALQFPGRFLQREQYAWDTTAAGIYGPFVKPAVVNESEFRLVDQLYNVGTVVGAPNGINLSIAYEQCLNNLAPGYSEGSIAMSKHQNMIRGWLLKDVQTSGWVKDLISSQHTQSPSTPPSATAASGVQPAHAITAAHLTTSSSVSKYSKPMFAISQKVTDNKVNRMELAEALMQEYLSAKQAWELERDDMIKESKGKDLDEITRRLAHITPIREAQLSAKHADAVVRGFSHAIRRYLGYMDVKSSAETLQDAKDALRESAVSSLDGSMKVYPVQMQPIDWFEGLSTSFTLEDLTSDPNLIADQLSSKSKQVDMLQARLATLQGRPKIDMQDLQNILDTAQTAYDKASSELAATYPTNVISLAKTCIDMQGQFSKVDFFASAKIANITETVYRSIADGMAKLATAQLTLTQASRTYTNLLASKALAEATDTTQEVTQIKLEINSITKDITELTSRLKSLRYRESDSSSKPNPNPLPSDPEPTPATGDTPHLLKQPAKVSVNDIRLMPPPTGSGGGRWQEVVMCHEISTKYSSEKSTSNASASKSDCNLFFGSYHSESATSAALSDAASGGSTLKVEIGFRVTMVTVDRGGWFQPQFFKQSSGFCHIDEKVSWSKWPKSVKSMSDLRTASPEIFEAINKYLLPAFPTGFIICKDITIKIHMAKSAVEVTGSSMKNMASSSSGVLCWSTSASHEESLSEKSCSVTEANDGCVIRIPGPQILGYMLQFTDPDITEPFPIKLPDGFLIPDDEYDMATKPVAAHAVSTNAVESSGGTKEKVNEKQVTPDPVPRVLT